MSLHRLTSTVLTLAACLLLLTSLSAQDATTPVAAESYLLAPFDQVLISVYDEPDLSSEQRISDEGKVSIPLLGELPIGGLSVSGAQKKIQQAFISERYLVRPVVTINVKEFAPKLITVTGEVERPGSTRIPIGMNSLPIEMAIAEAGGFTGAANKSAVKVTRKNDTDEVKLDVDVSRILDASDNQLMLYPGDIVVVPRRLF